MKYDVAVIGAGPAGSFAAEKLSTLGNKTLIIDPCEKKGMRRNPHIPVCKEIRNKPGFCGKGIKRS